jgi:copper chaperone CopZ
VTTNDAMKDFGDGSFGMIAGDLNSDAKVTFDTKLAVVTFDNEKTTLKALTDATKNAGYPSIIKQ